MSQRKGREARRAIKRRQQKKELLKDFVYNGYDFRRLVNNVIEIRYNKESYIGFVDSVEICFWSPNIKYAIIKLVTPEKTFNFYFTRARGFEFDAIGGKKDFYNSYKFEKKLSKAKIVRILPAVDAAIFKLEHDF